MDVINRALEYVRIYEKVYLVNLRKDEISNLRLKSFNDEDLQLTKRLYILPEIASAQTLIVALKTDIVHSSFVIVLNASQLCSNRSTDYGRLLAYLMAYKRNKFDLHNGSTNTLISNWNSYSRYESFPLLILAYISVILNRWYNSSRLFEVDLSFAGYSQHLSLSLVRPHYI